MNNDDAICKGTTGQRQVRPTVSDVLEDGTIVELIYRPEYRTFAKTHIRALDRAAAAEQRRSETEYELRRLEWPEKEQ